MIPQNVKLASLPNPTGRWLRLFALSSLTGLVAGLSAAAMEWCLTKGIDAIVGKVAARAGTEVLQFHPLVLFLPAIGGLASACIVLALCPKFARQGTEAMIHAFHRERGRLELQGPLVKAAASVVVIACGGSAGPEGPIAALAAAIGSRCGKLFRVSFAQRRILLIAGCAAGVGAIFRCPLGGALFAVSVPYSDPDYETEAIMPALVASVVGYSTFMALWGHGEFLFRGTDKLVFGSPLELLPFLALGPLCGLLAIFFGMSFQLVQRAQKAAHRLPPWLLPALGGLATGALACCLPQVMDARYDFLRGTMDGTLFPAGAGHPWRWVAFFAALALAKCAATSCTVGSGGAGGTLGPSLAIGGIAGALLGAICEALFPGIFPEPLRQSLIPVGMGGLLAASMRVPLAAIVMTAEMTGCYGLIVPNMLVCATAYLIGRQWGLPHEQVRSSIDSPVHATDVVIRLLESTPVSALLNSAPLSGTPLNGKGGLVVAPDAHLNQLVERLEPGEQPAFMVVENERLLGTITLPDLAHVLADSQLDRVVIAHDIMNERTDALTPDDSLYHALELFRHGRHSVLPVVSREAPHRFLGTVSRRTIFDALVERVNGLKELALGEHAGLLAIEEEARLDHVLIAMAGDSGPRVKRLMVPLDVIGKSIRQSRFRNCYGLQIVALERPDGTLECPPNLHTVLDGSYRLLVIAAAVLPDGTREAERLDSVGIDQRGTANRSAA